MDMLDFSNYLSDPRFDEFERINIPIIYDHIKNNQVLPFMLTLTDLQDGLIFHYTENRKQIGDFSSMESANIFFSQFLQHLFCYVLQEINDSHYLEVLLKAILNRHVDTFYYHSHEDIDAITLWIDPHSSETALTRACEQSDAEIVGLLLGNLKKTTRSSKKNLPPEFTYYLAQENNAGLSALNSVWIKEKNEIEVLLFQLAEEYFGNPSKKAFQQFFFQIDPEGRSALMRAVERNNNHLALLILEKCNELMRYDDAITQRLFFHQDQAGESILHRVVQAELDWLVFFLYQATEVLGATSYKFRDFLCLADKKGATALLHASQQENRKKLAEIFRFAVRNNMVLLDTAITLFRHQDNQGYTALMRAAERGYVENVKYLSNIWINMNSFGDILLHKEELFTGLSLRTRQGYSLLQVAAYPGHWQVLSHLLDSLELVSTVNRKLLLQTINYAIDSEDNLLTRLYREEVELMQLAHIQQRLLTPEETEISRIRLALANQLVVCNFRTVVRPTTASWQFIASRDWLERTSDFFSIFCGNRRHSRHRRAIEGQCAFLEKSYQASIPETTAQLYKESLINLIAIFTQQQSDSLIEVSRIRSTNMPSVREQSELDRFNQAVTQYYDRHGSAILNELKQTTIPSLDLVFVRDAAGILVDSGTHLLLLTQDKRLYSSLLDVAAPIPLVADINFSELSRWLATYFSSDYTLHPVNLESIVRHYPLVLTELSQPIISDRTLLKRHYEGVRGETLKNLFLFNQKLIECMKIIFPLLKLCYRL
jgi:ankyrin repeat protein